jgi:predicted secreted protein
MAIRSAKGTLMKLGNSASPEVFTTITQVRSIAGPTTKATVQDVTTHSTSGNWMEKLATLIDPGTLSFPVNYDKTDSAHAFSTGLWNLLTGLTQKNYRCVFPASIGYMQFAAYVTSHAFDLPVDNVIRANMELTINGAISTANTAEPS